MKVFITASLFFVSIFLFSNVEKIHSFFMGSLDLTALENYANQDIPNYINEDNTPNNNPINDREATLGRVLFYDVNLSLDNTISCASCHQQEFAFSDPRVLSVGRTGENTGRHSMRLINARFADEENFFWDERANSLEEQSTQPIQDHVEMGFSGEDGDPGIDSLFRKMVQLDHYQKLFSFVYGDTQINEQRLQRSLSQFIRSIQSFDSKYDEGRSQVNNNNAQFPNFTNAENRGKTLFMQDEDDGGANCQTCHSAPEFDIDDNSDNNGIIGVAGFPNEQDLTNTRAPSLRDLINPNGVINGPMMHTGEFSTLAEVIDHYDNIEENNQNLDRRLRNQNLNLSDQDKQDLVAFLRTLTGNDVYTNPKWSNPFDDAGQLDVILPCVAVETMVSVELCEGEVYNDDLTQVFMTSEGCDSIVNITLDYLPATADVLTALECCQNDCPSGYTVSGTYILPKSDANGCAYDEILELTILEAATEDINTEICEGSSLIVNGNVYDANNPSGTELMTAFNGCDSIVNVSLTFMSSIQVTIDEELCEGSSLIVNGNVYDENNPMGTEVLTATNGCDSIVNISLSFVQSIEENLFTTICEGDSIIVNGTIYNEDNPAGTELMTAVNGCDSIVNVSLSVMPHIFVTINVEVCEGEELPGIFTDVSQSSFGCDSTTTIIVSIFPNSETYIQQTCCEGDCTNAPGIYETVLASQAGCDSVIVLEVVELPIAFTQIDTSICPGEIFMGLEEEGNYEFTFVSENGCDSLLAVSLTLLDEVDCITSTENALESSTTISPNPFNDQISISTERIEGSYRLFGINGQLYMQGQITDDKTIISTSDLVSGLYILEVVDSKNNEALRKQVVKI